MSNCLTISEQLICAEIDEEIVGVSVENGNYYSFGPVGSEILQYIKDGNTVDEIIQKLSRGYDCDEETIRLDVSEFIQELKQHKIAE